MNEPRGGPLAAAQGRPGPSLKRQLLWWLLLPQLLLWCVAGLLGYRMALNYAEKGIDQSLTQTVRSLSRQVKPLGSGLLIDFPRAAQDIVEQDPQDRVSYMVSSPPGQFVLGNGKLPQPPQDVMAVTGEPRLYDGQLEGKPVRVALLEVDYGELASPQRLRVQVAKSLAVRDRIAKELVADMLLPLLVLGALISTLVYFGIGRGLRPLQRLEALLEGRSGKSLTALAPIELNEAPLEVHSLAAALNQMLGAVSKSVSQEKRFLSDAAHQLRTPLAGLISQTELALQAADDAALRARLEKVHAGATRSAHLVHQLLALARSEGAVQLRDVDLAQLARDVARLWTPKALARKMDLGFEGADHVWIKGEQLLLQEALSNLLDNALLYAGAGAIVTVRVREQTPWAILEVEDSGPGLPPADRERVFERFWRGSDAPGGCGLGLAIVSEIAERHGGQARALEVPEQGFCLRLQLPLRPPD